MFERRTKTKDSHAWIPGEWKMSFSLLNVSFLLFQKKGLYAIKYWALLKWNWIPSKKTDREHKKGKIDISFALIVTCWHSRCKTCCISYTHDTCKSAVQMEEYGKVMAFGAFKWPGKAAALTLVYPESRKKAQTHNVLHSFWLWHMFTSYSSTDCDSAAANTQIPCCRGKWICCQGLVVTTRLITPLWESSLFFNTRQESWITENQLGDYILPS